MSREVPRPVRVFTPADLLVADPTPGMNRSLAFELPLLWAGQVETEPGAVSGWHHHERNESSLYVVRGVLRLEFEGHDGYLDAGPGDFVHVPAWTVHRESNPSDEPSLAVIARVGGGIATVNVDETKGAHMAELVRTNDPSIISVVEDLLTEAEIPYQVADRNMSVLEGGINAIQVRILVPDHVEAQARTLLTDADLGHWLRQ